jgi:hypothetical protein
MFCRIRNHADIIIYYVFHLADRPLLRDRFCGIRNHVDIIIYYVFYLAYIQFLHYMFCRIRNHVDVIIYYVFYLADWQFLRDMYKFAESGTMLTSLFTTYFIWLTDNSCLIYFVTCVAYWHHYLLRISFGGLKIPTWYVFLPRASYCHHYLLLIS